MDPPLALTLTLTLTSTPINPNPNPNRQYPIPHKIKLAVMIYKDCGQPATPNYIISLFKAYTKVVVVATWPSINEWSFLPIWLLLSDPTHLVFRVSLS